VAAHAWTNSAGSATLGHRFNWDPQTAVPNGGDEVRFPDAPASGNPLGPEFVPPFGLRSLRIGTAGIGGDLARQGTARFPSSGNSRAGGPGFPQTLRIGRWP
jgi:hypothetical protein